MGKFIDPDQPMSDDTKEFLRGRGRADEVVENERRFPDGGPAEHEEAGYMPTKPGYDYQAQAEKTEDATGLPIDRVPVDADGKPLVEEYGNTGDDDGDDEDTIDDDIIESALALDVAELKTELKKLKLPVSGNKEELIDRLVNAKQDARDEANKAAE